MKSIKRIVLILLITTLFLMGVSGATVYAQTPNATVTVKQTEKLQIKISLDYLNYSDEITPDLFGIQGLEILEVNKIKRYNENTGANELTGYFVVVEVDDSNNADELVTLLNNLDFVEEVKKHYSPESFDLEIDISKINKENRILSVFGDVNSDYVITASDARAALRIAANLEKKDETELKIADINGDGKVTSADARKILRACANLENLQVSYTMNIEEDYLIGPVGTSWYIGKWQIASADEKLIIIEDYSLDVTAPGNIGYNYYQISASEKGEYKLIFENEKQNKTIEINIIV